MLGESVAPSQTYVNANGDALPPPPPVDQPGLVPLGGSQSPDLGFVALPLGFRLLKSKAVVGRAGGGGGGGGGVGGDGGGVGGGGGGKAAATKQVQIYRKPIN